MKSMLIVLGISLALSGCATSKQWAATGGSRADGTVRLSYEVGSMEVPQTNDMQGQQIAAARCKTWGYTGAEAFGGVTRQCNAPSGFGCDRWIVTKEFQRTGTHAPSSK